MDDFDFEELPNQKALFPIAPPLVVPSLLCDFERQGLHLAVINGPLNFAQLLVIICSTCGLGESGAQFELGGTGGATPNKVVRTDFCTRSGGCVQKC